MLKLLLATAPYLMKGRSKTSQKVIASRLLALAFFTLGGFALLIALFLWVEPRFGADTAWLITGLILFGFGVIFMSRSKAKPFPAKSENANSVLNLTDSRPAFPDNDPLAAFLPESFKNDSHVATVMRHVSKNPVAASAAALGIGMLISKELFGE